MFSITLFLFQIPVPPDSQNQVFHLFWISSPHFSQSGVDVPWTWLYWGRRGGGFSPWVTCLVWGVRWACPHSPSSQGSFHRGETSKWVPSPAPMGPGPTCTLSAVLTFKTLSWKTVRAPSEAATLGLHSHSWGAFFLKARGENPFSFSKFLSEKFPVTPGVLWRHETILLWG